jgi:hypothetical protein
LEKDAFSPPFEKGGPGGIFKNAPLALQWQFKAIFQAAALKHD